MSFFISLAARFFLGDHLHNPTQRDMEMPARTKNDDLPVTFQGLKLKDTTQTQHRYELLDDAPQDQGKAKLQASSSSASTHIVQPLKAHLPCASLDDIALRAQQNLQNSRLYQLPLELLIEVDKHLSGAEPIALRATSRKFLTNLKRTTPSKETCRQFLKLLRNNDFFRACAEEHGGQSRVGHPQLCGHCKRTHLPSHFSTTQLRAPPETRKCHGINGVLRVCEHMQFSFHELRALRELSPDGNFFCNMHETFISSFGTIAQPRPMLRLSQYGSYTRRIMAFAATHYLHISSLQPFSTHRIFAALASMDHHFLCAHVRLSDPRTFTTRLKELAPPDFWASNVSEHECKVETCDTSFQVCWVRSHDSADGGTVQTGPVDTMPRWEIWLMVWRRLGMLDTPICPKWMAFMERNGEE